MAYLHLAGVEKHFGPVHAIKGIELSIERGEFVVFVGPSGCGKSTLLRMIAGLESTDSGRIHLDGRDITELPSAKRDLAMVFQSYALYPHMSVFDNMSFALRLAGASKEVMREKVERAARILDLVPYLGRTPRELSGGQRQRVAIGRAIVRAPKVFLFDEPLSNLDAALRGQTRVEIANLHRELGATTIYVTHDQVEAMTLADRVVVLRDGAIEQVGSPLELYERPANRFVAQFIGQPAMNVLAATALPALAMLATQAARAAPAASSSSLRIGLPADGFVGVRPEAVKVLPAGQGRAQGTVALVEALGAQTLVHVDLDGAPMVAALGPRTPWRRGDTVGIELDATALHFFDASGLALAARVSARNQAFHDARHS